jgi:hypothetical protein
MDNIALPRASSYAVAGAGLGGFEMFAGKIKVLVLSILVLLMLLSVQVTRAADITSGNFPACRHCPGGGGGGSGSLTQDEIEGMKYMREEEKLARDSYLTLYDQWHLAIFYKISNSEVMHMSKVKDLLDRYGLPDPAAGNPVGVFTNPILQQLYNDLMAQGSQSSMEALRVGVTIEEVDIADLQKYLALTNKADIINVYAMLMNGSYRHLDAFNYQLGQ